MKTKSLVLIAASLLVVSASGSSALAQAHDAPRTVRVVPVSNDPLVALEERFRREGEFFVWDSRINAKRPVLASEVIARMRSERETATRAEQTNARIQALRKEMARRGDFLIFDGNVNAKRPVHASAVIAYEERRLAIREAIAQSFGMSRRYVEQGKGGRVVLQETPVREAVEPTDKIRR